MATYRGGKGQRGAGEWKKPWFGSREYNKSGSSSPSMRRSNSPRRGGRTATEYTQHLTATQHRLCVNHLQEEWRKVEQDLARDPGKVTGTVEYVVKTPMQDIKDEEPKNREEKPPSVN